jgi:hypothetical protein
VSDEIRIESFTPQPLWDGRRVTLILHVSGLPTYGPGSHFLSLTDTSNHEADAEEPAQTPRKPNVNLFHQSPASEESGPSGQERPSSPYPNVTLSIFDQHGSSMATTYIIEHKEPELDFTLHVPPMEPGIRYLARAEMVINDEIIQVVEVPFEFVSPAAENGES